MASPKCARLTPRRPGFESHPDRSHYSCGAIEATLKEKKLGFQLTGRWSRGALDICMSWTFAVRFASPMNGHANVNVYLRKGVYVSVCSVGGIYVMTISALIITEHMEDHVFGSARLMRPPFSMMMMMI